MPRTTTPRSVAPLLALAAAGAATAAVPPYTITSLARSNLGGISSPFAFTPGAGPGILKVAVDNEGRWLINAHLFSTNTAADELLMRTGMPNYVVEGLEGHLLVPTTESVAHDFHSVALNNTGRAGIAMGIEPGEFSSDPTTSATLLNTDRLAALEGAPVNAAGLAPGTVWARFDAGSAVKVTDSNLVLVASNVIESGVTRRAIVVLQTDAAGAVTGATLVAKEGGPVGAGPDTWTTLATGGHAVAINTAGSVVFSGSTASGTNGVFRNGAFVAVQGGPTPVAGTVWGVLAGAPVDINNAGVVVFRAKTGTGSGLFTETSPDAGHEEDTADRTFGNGPLTRVSGTLSNDHDVDMFRFVCTDAAAFSATTVPDPGSGFPGASWDTVLAIIAEPGNGTRGRVRSDNVSPGIPQSTVTGSQLITGREYFLAISTPKSRPVARIRHYATDSFPLVDIWTEDPAGLAVDAAGTVYWPDPSAGVVGHATGAGAALPSLPAAAVSQHVAVLNAGAASKIYWADTGTGGAGNGPKIRRANLDGSSPEEIVTVQGFGTLTADDATGLAVDAVNGKVYWTRSIYGEINRCNLDGTSPERVIQDYHHTQGMPPATATLAPGSIAVDGAGGKIYWVNTFLDRIERSNLDGSARTTLPAGQGAAALALHAAAGKVYWTNTAGNAIQRANLDGSAIETVLTTPAPAAIAIDATNGFVYWTNTSERRVRRASLAAPVAADVVTLPPDTGERAPDGPAAGDSFETWLRSGSPVAAPLPYQIRLTGATFKHEHAMIVKGGQKFVAVGDTPSGSPYPIAAVGGASSPVRLSDRGDVLWNGLFYRPTEYINFVFDAVFLNQDPLLASMDVPAGTNTDAQKVINVYTGPYSFDLSDNGRFALLAVNMQDPPYNFTFQRDNALLVEFTLPPQCRADFNADAQVNVADIFAFLSAWFAQGPGSDFNADTQVNVADIFAFLSAWFAGCP